MHACMVSHTTWKQQRNRFPTSCFSKTWKKNVAKICNKKMFSIYKTNYSYTKKLHCTSLSQTEFGFFFTCVTAYYCIYILYYVQYIFFSGFAVPFTHMEQGNNVRTSLICTVEKCIIRDPYTITIINRQLPIVSRNAYFLIRSHSLDAPEK